MVKDCRPITVSEPNTKCFNVTTKTCFYDEKVEYEVIDTYLPKQVCYSDKGMKISLIEFIYVLKNTFICSARL